MKNGREEMRQESQLGAEVCRMIKVMYFQGALWQDCYKDVARKFSTFKAILRKFYGMNKMQALELLAKTSRMSRQNIQEVFDMEGDIISPEAQGLNTNDDLYGNKVTWIPVPIDQPELILEVRKLLAG